MHSDKLRKKYYLAHHNIHVHTDSSWVINEYKTKLRYNYEYEIQFKIIWVNYFKT